MLITDIGERIAAPIAVQRIWPTRETINRLSMAGLVLVALLGSHAVASLRRIVPPPPPSRHERNFQQVPTHISEFAAVEKATASRGCADTRLPEAILTPDPVMQEIPPDGRIRVSFIIGADGHVHSAFILESGSQSQDQAVLNAIRHWRYRPALCNGVPTEIEARVSFVLR